MLTYLKENIYKLMAVISLLYICHLEDKFNSYGGFNFIEGVGHKSYFFFFDTVQGVSILFYLIWPFFIDPNEYDKRSVILFTLRRTIEIVSLSIVINATLLICSCYGFFEQPDTVIVSLGGLIRIDSYAITSKLIVLVFSLFFLFLAYAYFKKTNTFLVVEFPACASFSILCLANMSFVHDFFLFFLVMEAVAFVTILFTILNFSKLSVEGAIKYFIMNSLAAGLFLMGCLMIYSVCMSTNYFVLHELISVKIGEKGSNLASPNFILGLGAILIVVSVIFKLGGYPFNLYVPDVYESSPTFVVFFLSVVVKVTFFLYLIRLLSYVFFDLSFFCSVVLALSAVSSILIGSIGGLIQGNIKRLFGYASVNQIGFLLAGLSALTYISIKATVFYFFIYISAASIFLFVISSSYNESAGRSIQFFSELKSLYNLSAMSTMAIPLHLVFIFSVFSMCGLPPLAGFFGKYFLMFGILKDGSFIMVFFILLGSAISAFYYLKFVFQLVSYDSTIGPDLSNDVYSFEDGYDLKLNAD